jgi:hypothetical protein
VHKVGRLISPSRLLTLLQLAKLDYLAAYFDTDAQSMAGLSYETAVDRFSSMVAYPRLSMLVGVMTRLFRSHETGPLKLINLS